MRHFTPHRLRPLKGSGVAMGSACPMRPANRAGLPLAAEANIFISTRTYPARARMAAGEGDQILVGLFDRAETVAQVRDGPFFEGDDRGHGRGRYASAG